VCHSHTKDAVTCSSLQYGRSGLPRAAVPLHAATSNIECAEKEPAKTTGSLCLCCHAIEIDLQIGSTACARMAGHHIEASSQRWAERSAISHEIYGGHPGFRRRQHRCRRCCSSAEVHRLCFNRQCSAAVGRNRERRQCGYRGSRASRNPRECHAGGRTTPLRPPQGRVFLRSLRGRIDCCRRAFDSARGLFWLSIAKAAGRTVAGTRSEWRGQPNERRLVVGARPTGAASQVAGARGRTGVIS
jgi:hypothetical protein